MAEPDPVMTRIGEALALGQQGDRAAARARFSELWEELGPEGDPVQRCALAHAMADVQDDPHEELVWDQRALGAAERITEARLAEVGVVGSVRGFYPSLHLNLGDVYRRLGEFELARTHLELGREAEDALEDDGYAQLVREGLDRLARRLDGSLE